MNETLSINYSDYSKVSPFELKNTLIKIAKQTVKSDTNKEFLNAGRGNPNFVSTPAREAYSVFNLFCCQESERNFPEKGLHFRNQDIGTVPGVKDIGTHFNEYMKTFLDEHKKKNSLRKGAVFLVKAVHYMYTKILKKKLNYDEFIHELFVATLGNFYPSPPRRQPFVKKVMNKYAGHLLTHGHITQYDVFLTEGATAAIVYTFRSLVIQGILNNGDSIAIITPIFSPYLEIPKLHQFNFNSVYLEGNQDNDWKIPIKELDKLYDKKIKALFLVNPTNPSSVSLTKKHVNYIASIIKTKRKDLIIITDDVYAPFVDNYYSLLEKVPQNTIAIHSFSKYYGVTGLRMGLIMMERKNIIDDKLIPNLPEKKKKELRKRYEIVTMTGQDDIKFIDRLLMDSRDVAEAHTAGLATPQQMLMCLFAVYDMTHKKYKKDIQKILRQRIKYLYKPLGISPPLGKLNTDYYTLINIKKLVKKRYGNKFVENMIKKSPSPLEIVFRLAQKYSTICLPAKGFGGHDWGIRVSLANLPTLKYLIIGENIDNMLKDLYSDYN